MVKCKETLIEGFIYHIYICKLVTKLRSEHRLSRDIVLMEHIELKVFNSLTVLGFESMTIEPPLSYGRSLQCLQSPTSRWQYCGLNP